MKLLKQTNPQDPLAKEYQQIIFKNSKIQQKMQKTPSRLEKNLSSKRQMNSRQIAESAIKSNMQYYITEKNQISDQDQKLPDNINEDKDLKQVVINIKRELQRMKFQNSLESVGAKARKRTISQSKIMRAGGVTSTESGVQGSVSGCQVILSPASQNRRRQKSQQSNQNNTAKEIMGKEEQAQLLNYLVNKDAQYLNDQISQEQNLANFRTRTKTLTGAKLGNKKLLDSYDGKKSSHLQIKIPENQKEKKLSKINLDFELLQVRSHQSRSPSDKLRTSKSKIFCASPTLGASNLINKQLSLKPDFKVMQQIKYQEKLRQKIAKQMRSPKHPDIILADMQSNLQKIKGIQQIRKRSQKSNLLIVTQANRDSKLLNSLISPKAADSTHYLIAKKLH